MQTSVILLAIAMVMGANATSLRGLQSFVPEADLSNLCNARWDYCPRDPGCTTYKMSVHSTMVEAVGYANPLQMENLKPGDEVTLTVKGETTLTEIPAEGTYKIHSLDGPNIGSGVLSDVMQLDGSAFTITVTVILNEDVFVEDRKWVEFGLDVFQSRYGTNEAFCIEIYNDIYQDYIVNKPSPKYVMLCDDNGNGVFTPASPPVPLTGHDIPAETCEVTPASLFWWLCPRDPGCVTYDASVTHVEVTSSSPDGIVAGAQVRLVLNGTTRMREVPDVGSYRIYALSGHNVVAGALGDVLSLFGCEERGCHYSVDVEFVAPASVVDPARDRAEFGLDMFRERYGTMEMMCVEIGNQAYMQHETTKLDPPFDVMCEDKGWGHYVRHTEPDEPAPVQTIFG